MKNWSRKETEEVINLVQQHQCIYNVRCCEYLDRNKKAEAMNAISVEMIKMDSEVNVEEIKRKWKNLRTQYMQEMRAIKQSKKSGSGVSDVYTPKLWCFQQLNFLESHIESRASVDNIKTNPYFTVIDDIPSCNEEVNATNEVYAVDESDISRSSSSQNTTFTKERPAKRQKKSQSMDELRKDLHKVKNVLGERKNPEKKLAWLGALVVETMEEIGPEDRDAAVWQVQCLMRKLKADSKRKLTSPASSMKDILELSMEGIFDEDDVI